MAAVPAARVEPGAGLVPRAPPRRARAQYLGPDYRLGYLFVAPIAIAVLALVGYPFLLRRVPVA